MKVGVIIQARMSSSRLPGKVLKELPYNSGIAVIEHVVNRAGRASLVDAIILATSDKISDDELFHFANDKGILTYRGDLDNVLERYYLAATEYNLDLVVRITGDCPCIDPDIIDDVVKKHIQTGADFSSNAYLRTFPHGMDVAVMNYDALKEAYANTKFEYEREHVTTYFYKTHPEKYKTNYVGAIEKYSFPKLRLSLDTPEDYTLLCSLFDELHNKNKDFGIDDILALFKDKPWLENINSKITQKQVHTTLEGEMSEVIEYCQRQDLLRAKEHILGINSKQ